MWLNFPQLLPADHPQAAKAVGFSAPAQLFEAWKFVRVRRNNDLPADFVGNPMLAAKCDHRHSSADAKTSLHGARLVVDAGMDHATVVSALVEGNAVFFLE